MQIPSVVRCSIVPIVLHRVCLLISSGNSRLAAAAAVNTKETTPYKITTASSAKFIRASTKLKLTQAVDREVYRYAAVFYPNRYAIRKGFAAL